MNSRMAHIAEEKLLIEKRINDAATTIQKYVKMTQNEHLIDKIGQNEQKLI